MLYKFKSKATGDLIMLGPHADEVMQLLGREPAAQGIFEVADLPGLIALLEHAVAEDEAARARAKPDELHEDAKFVDTDADQAQWDTGVSLRQRLWPLVENMKLAHAQAQSMVWGV